MLLLKTRIFAEVFLLAVLGFAFPSLAAQKDAEGKSQSSPDPPVHTVVFMSDFGTVDDSVAICKAVMLHVDPTLRIMDITHQVVPYSIPDGARFLAGTAPYYGPGTVFVAVIDPGVGSRRKAIVARSKLGQYFVVPDNGLLTLIEDRDGILEAREITNPDWMIGSKLSSTFHGRDIFSPVGARIARGDDWTQVGPVVPELVRLRMTPTKMEEGGLSGEVIASDGPYGNLITNIEAGQFARNWDTPWVTRCHSASPANPTAYVLCVPSATLPKASLCCISTPAAAWPSLSTAATRNHSYTCLS